LSALRVGIVGAGLIGSRRADFAAAAGDAVVAVADVDSGRAGALAGRHGARPFADWRRLLDSEELDAVVVATVNRHLSEISVAALEAGRHVLCEKPPGRTAAEAVAMASAQRRSGRVLKIGFNLRFHPALARAHELFSAGEIGSPLYVRAVYGHGGRPGYGSEWRADLELAGGGELLDQGVHVIDLCRWFLGDFSEAEAILAGLFWTSAPVEDNAFVTLRTAEGQVAAFHSSWTQWRNHFSFEVYGSEGCLQVEGLGGSYGPESLVLGRRLPGRPPEEIRTEFPEDVSWRLDWHDFVEAVAGRRAPACGGEDGVEVMRLVDRLYARARPGEAAR